MINAISLKICAVLQFNYDKGCSGLKKSALFRFKVENSVLEIM